MTILSESPPASQDTGGWFRLRNDSLNHIATVGHLAWAVYCVLAKHANERGECWPSQETIGKICGVSDRAIRDATRRLEAAGLVRTEKRQRSSNLYLLSTIPPVNGRNVASGQDLPFELDRKQASGQRRNVASGLDRKPASGELDPLEEDPLEGKRESAAVAAAPAELQAFVDCWNANAPDGKRVKTITKALRIGWARTKDPELREAFSDLAALGTAIRNASWARKQNWFTAESLFAKDSNKLAWKVRKLLNGEYSGGNNGQAKQRVVPSPGCRNDTGASITANF